MAKLRRESYDIPESHSHGCYVSNISVSSDIEGFFPIGYPVFRYI